MAFDMNLVVISGNLGRDPEMSYTPQGTAVVKFSVACSTGKDQTTWFDCEAWDKTAESVNQYASKGTSVLLNGRIKIDSYEAKDGSGKRKSTKVVANFVKFLNGANFESAAAPAPSAGFETDDIPF